MERVFGRGRGAGYTVGRGREWRGLVLHGDMLRGCCAGGVGLERSRAMRDTLCLCGGFGETTSSGVGEGWSLERLRPKALGRSSGRGFLRNPHQNLSFHCVEASKAGHPLQPLRSGNWHELYT